MRSHSSEDGQRWRKLINSNKMWYPLKTDYVQMLGKG